MGAGTKRRRRGGLITEINVTPLVDIMLVLLVIFMLTAQLLHTQVLEVDLPTAKTSTASEHAMLTIALPADGGLFIDGHAATPAELDQAVAAALRADPKAQVIVAGDRQTPHGRVVWLIDRLNSLGMGAFNIQVDPTQLDPPTPPMPPTPPTPKATP